MRPPVWVCSGGLITRWLKVKINGVTKPERDKIAITWR